MTTPALFRCPVHVPGPGGDTPPAREPLWFAYATGTDRPLPPRWAEAPQPPPDEHVAPPPPVAARGGAISTLPLGTTELLDAAPYPHGRPQAAGLEGALVTAFGVSRREPDNPYNDHRSYASARCLFPVRAAVVDGGRARLLDPGRHALTALDVPALAPDRREVVLAGSYPAVPADYRFFRGSVVALELGIALRALGVALELHGLPARLRLPGPDAVARLAELGLTPTTDWSLPLTVDLADTPDLGPGPVEAPVADPVLVDILAANRARQLTVPRRPAGFGTAVPAAAGACGSGLSWAELLWRRNSGRMPRGMHGMSARPRTVPGSALVEAAAWASAPPPGDLAAVFDAVRVTAVVRGVAGVADGVHRVRDGVATLHAPDPQAGGRLEDAYFYPLTPGSGCDIRHAPMTFLFSVHPRRLVERFGPGAWTAAQYACGWAAHGVGLAAAAAGLFARPVRAFRETDVQRLVDLDPDETLVFAVVTGTPRPVAGPLLDLRV